MKIDFSHISKDDPEAQRAISFLIYSGWAITLSYFPSGFLLFYIGSFVYVRDLLLAVHFVLCLVWLRRTGDLFQVLRQSAILALVPLYLIPAVVDSTYTAEALRTVKWTFTWLDWIFIGHFVYHNRRWTGLLKIFIWITVGELFCEWFIGAFEWQAGHYVFSTPTTFEDKTLFGVQAVKEMELGGHIRVRGLQRDVFAFANLMAMSSVLGLACASIAREARQRAAGFIWCAAFAGMLVVSGGRSALMGIFASVLLSVAYLVDPAITRRWAKTYILVWVGIAVIISFVGVGQITDAVSGTVFGRSHLGDSTSAYMRDENWKNIMAAFEQQPTILMIGGPFASLIDSGIAPMFHWADNQFLWDVYHLGIAGAIAIAFYFFRVIRFAKPGTQGMHIIVLFLLFVIGEGIARESLTFEGCLPLFVACGYVSAATAAAASAAPVDDRKSRHHHHRRRRSKFVQPSRDLNQ